MREAALEISGGCKLRERTDFLECFSLIELNTSHDFQVIFVKAWDIRESHAGED